MSRILGIDCGSKRMGLAISDPDGILATPLRTDTVTGIKNALELAAAAFAEEGAETVVVGLPLNMDGTHGPQAEWTTAFADKLRDKLGVQVDMWDERLTTKLVERVLIEADLSRAKRKKVRDKLAAQVILQGYLDSHSPPLEYDPFEDQV